MGSGRSLGERLFRLCESADRLGELVRRERVRQADVAFERASDTKSRHLMLGLIALAFFDALYLGAQFRSGPRDGIMTGLVRLTRLPVAAVRTGIEVVVAGIGWLLGGTVGAGTVLIALCMGPLVGFFLPRTAVRLPSTSPCERRGS